MEQDPDSPPTFWFQPPHATTRRRRTPPIDPVVLIILIPILAIIFIFFILPLFLSHTSHILKPGSIKSTWDSLNILLVVFAILCGVLARKNDDGASSDEVNSFVAESSNSNNQWRTQEFITSNSNNSVQSSGQWVRFSDRKPGQLRRNSSSYPDLRQDSGWGDGENGENRSRFFDDFDVDLYSSPASRCYNNFSRRGSPVIGVRERGNLYRSVSVPVPPVNSGGIHRRSGWSEADHNEAFVEKEIFVDTFEVRQNATTPPPPSAQSASLNTHSFRSVAKKVNAKESNKTESRQLDETRSYPPPPPPPPPPPAPPPPQAEEVRTRRSRNKHKKLERKVSDATKEIATAISSLYNQRKRKNKRKSRSIPASSDTSPPSVHFVRSETETELQSMQHQQQQQQQQQTSVPQPPPPPPPPPPSMFHNLFKKGGKHKRIHSVPGTVSRTVPVPPPPPPPPPSSIFNNILKSVGKSKRFHHPSPPPPPPSSIMNSVSRTGTKSKRFGSITNAFSSSPPPPPPLPPPMTPPRYTIKSKQISTSKAEPQNRRSTSKNGKPPLPTKTSGYYERDDFLPSGSQSPLIPLPPPPPPFKMSAMKFELRGDFVKIRSSHSSVCSSPDRDDIEFSSMGLDAGDSNGPGSVLTSGPKFFPSPDVNAKAESFISRLKDEWRMEKKNYVKEKMG